MKITDEMVREALAAYQNGWHASNADMSRCIRAALTAALATQPDRYKAGFERAREMAAEKVGWYCARANDACANAIRSMEMPDE